MRGSRFVALSRHRAVTLMGDAAETPRPRLAVVVITRNQASTIGPLIRSVLSAAEGLAPFEIVVVDSASDDDTVRIAQQFPVRIVRLDPGHRLTAAAGRYVGFHRTRADRVLFVDGDMELCSGWLSLAVEVLDADESIGGGTGIVLGPGEPGPASIGAVDRPKISELTCRDVGGIGLYSRPAM